MGTTSNRGWPYPESSDYVADGATAIENLADAIDGSLGAGYIYVTTLKFTSSSTFTKASYSYLKAVRVRMCGGGGAGGGSSTTSSSEISCGGGGGGAGYLDQFILESALGASETITIGAGGSGVSGGNGGNGGTTSFGSICSAGGGFGGSYAPASTPSLMFGTRGLAGSFSGTGQGINGEAGHYGLPVTSLTGRVASAVGGSSHLAPGGHQLYTASASAGVNGGGYGAGGSGALADNNTASTYAGGDGFDGVLYLDLYA
jgi:hypothetical protein